MDDLEYYLDKYPNNTSKAMLGESSLDSLDYPTLRNITYGHRQKDIDALILTSKSLFLNEIKNTAESWKVTYSWFLSHILSRYVDSLPIAQWYARTLGYSGDHIRLLLTIPKLNCSTHVRSLFKSLKISVIETSKQLTNESYFKEKAIDSWARAIRSFFLSVLQYRYTNVNCSAKCSVNQDSKDTATPIGEPGGDLQYDNSNPDPKTQLILDCFSETSMNSRHIKEQSRILSVSNKLE